MQLNEHIKQQRWAMLTNTTIMKVPPMCRVTEQEIIEHLLWIDATDGGGRLSTKEKIQCRKRFRAFCKTQWKNRSRN